MASGGDVDRDGLATTFQEITGIEDLERCREVLEAHQWNLETAVHDTLNEAEGIAPVFKQPTPTHDQPTVAESASLRHAAAAGLEDEDVNHPQASPPPVPSLRDSARHVAQRRQMTWIEWGYTLFTLPFRFVSSTVFDVVRFVAGLIFPRLNEVVDAEGDVRRFIDEFVESYGSDGPQFLQCSYAQALIQSKRDLRFLLVYLHSPHHHDTEEFCSTALCGSGLTRYLSDNFLVWGASVLTPEGQRVAGVMRTWTHPFIAVIAYLDGRMVCVDKIEGTHSVDEIVARLMHTSDTYSGVLAAARRDRQRATDNQQLRDMQDRELAESLRLDQEKEERKRQQVAEAERAERERQERKAEKEQRAQDLRRRREEAGQELPVEPTLTTVGAVRISVRLPDNSRLERRFHVDDSLKAIHNFIFSQSNAPAEFSMHTNYPKRILNCTGDAVQTIGEAGLAPAAMLMVHDEGDGDTDEEM